MKYDFDKVIDRRNNDVSYSMKWGSSPLIANMLGVKEITDDTIAVFTADMDFECAKPISDALVKVAEHGIYGYSLFPSEYYDAIINWFDRRHDWTIKREEIIYVDGTVEAMKQVINCFTDEGDGVIIQRPVYGPFTSSIEGSGRVVVNNQMIETDGYYTMDFKDLEEKAKDPKNKLLLLCSPHNPVGRIWKDEELIELARICRENDVLIFADEIHGDLIRKGTTFTPLAKIADPVNIITATAVNKTFNLAGLHCTNLVISNEDIRNKFKEYFGLNLPSPFTIAAAIAAYDEGEEWLDQLIDYLDDNIDFVLNFFKERMPKVKCLRPEGTYIMWMDFREYGLSAEEIHEKIYIDANVLLESGSMFDPDLGEGFERICVPSPRSVIEEALERIAKQFEGL